MGKQTNGGISFSKKVLVIIAMIAALLYTTGTVMISKPGTYQTIGGETVTYPVAGIYWKYGPFLLVEFER